MDYMVISGYLRGTLLDVNVFRGVAGGMSDHYLVEGRIKVNGRFVRREGRNVREVVKIEELEKKVNIRRYQEKIGDIWQRKREMEWEVLRDSGKKKV